MSVHRDRIWETMTSNCPDLAPPLYVAASHLWGGDYDCYVSDWLPKPKNAAIVDMTFGGTR